MSKVEEEWWPFSISTMRSDKLLKRFPSYSMNILPFENGVSWLNCRVYIKLVSQPLAEDIFNTK
jgi:hypothetical protein